MTCPTESLRSRTRVMDTTDHPPYFCRNVGPSPPGLIFVVCDILFLGFLSSVVGLNVQSTNLRLL